MVVNTIQQELMALDEDMKEDNKASSFIPGSNKITIWSLVARVLIYFKQRWGTEKLERFLNENVDCRKD
jgi:hypothetical protein